MIHTILAKIKSCNTHTKTKGKRIGFNNERLHTYTKFRYAFDRGFLVKSPILFGDFAKIHISKYLNFITGVSTSQDHLEIYHPQQC